MTALPRHPASKLPEAARIEYLNTVASMALVDKSLDPAELERVGRLADEIGLSAAVKAEQLVALSEGRTAEVGRDVLLRFAAEADLRTSLMMDSIVIAFSDGRLVPSESRQLSTLATALWLNLDDVLATARLVESFLFARDNDEEQELARQLGEALAGAPGWLRRVSGVMLVAP